VGVCGGAGQLAGRQLAAGRGGHGRTVGRRRRRARGGPSAKWKKCGSGTDSATQDPTTEATSNGSKASNISKFQRSTKTHNTPYRLNEVTRFIIRSRMMAVHGELAAAHNHRHAVQTNINRNPIQSNTQTPIPHPPSTQVAPPLTMSALLPTARPDC
jgi:hypothetical protein